MEQNGITLVWRMGEVEKKLDNLEVKFDELDKKVSRVEGALILIRYAIVLGAALMSAAAIIAGWLVKGG